MIKIIAEAGVNHNGSLQNALRLVDEAAAAKADYIKFKTFKTAGLVTASCKAAGYQTRNSGAENQADMLSALELSFEDFEKINRYCSQKGIGFLSTPFDSESVDFIESLNPDFIKVPSGEITDLPYLRKVASTHIPAIISTGMSTITDIEDALEPFREAGYSNFDIILLHCTTQYPTPLHDVNLRAIETLRRHFNLPVGYSDHTQGILVPLAAAALEAVVIEKHFTLSRSMEGPDHAASLEPDELKQMVAGIRNVEIALGSSAKSVTDSDKANLKAARRSIVAARFIHKGKIITVEDICAKRPGGGLSPMLWDMVVGSAAKRDFMPDEFIEL